MKCIGQYAIKSIRSVIKDKDTAKFIYSNANQLNINFHEVTLYNSNSKENDSDLDDVSSY